MNSRGSGNPQKDLNHMSPAANVACLGDMLSDLTVNYNLLVAQHNALVAALGAGGGNVPNVTTALAAYAAPVAIVNRLVTPTVASS